MYCSQIDDTKRRSAVEIPLGSSTDLPFRVSTCYLIWWISPGIISRNDWRKKKKRSCRGERSFWKSQLPWTNVRRGTVRLCSRWTNHNVYRYAVCRVLECGISEGLKYSMHSAASGERSLVLVSKRSGNSSLVQLLCLHLTEFSLGRMLWIWSWHWREENRET